MRILHLTDRLNGRGGAYSHLAGVVAAQVERGHRVWLAGGTDEDASHWPCPTRVVAGLDARTAAPARLDALAQELAPDIVHLHTIVNPTVLEWAAGRRALITVQDHRYFCPARGKWTRDGFPCREPLGRASCASCFDDAGYFEEVWGLTRARLDALKRVAVVVLSEYMRRELIAAGVEPQRVSVVPPFVHGLDPRAEASGPPCLLFAGRLSETKGVMDAVAAWRGSALDLPLVMAGTGPLREEAAEAGAQVLGWVEHARMAGLYRRAAAVLMPSRWQEPFGITGLEALTLGTPVVAWRSGGVEEWHSGGDTLVPWGDVDALAQAARSAIGQPARAPSGFERDALMLRLDEAYGRA